MELIKISNLGHTWFIDIDGTILEHNGHKKSGDKLLPGVHEFWSSIPKEDVIVLVSARSKEEAITTIDFLKKNGIHHHYFIHNLPTGERILINAKKPSNLKTAIALNLERNSGLSNIKIAIDNYL